MKKQHLLYVVLTLFAFGLITACSKSNDTPAPNSPVVGQFDINRVEYTDVMPTSLSISNMTSTTGLGMDSYTFKNDNTYSDTYDAVSAAGVSSTQTETGTYSYATSTQTVTLTPAPQSGQSVTPYAFIFNSSTNELSTGKLAQQGSVKNPTTGVSQAITYNINYIYKKK